MIESEEPTRETRADDPAALVQALELELIQQRAAWRKVSARRGTWRALSLFFLLLLGLAALVTYFYILPQLRSRAGEKGSSPIEAAP